MSKNTASIKDIAEAAGVSVSTVSRVINGKSYVNEATRQKVLAMADKINYQPNFLAKSLKMGRTNTICLLLPSIENLIFPAITRGVEEEARKHGFNVILCNSDEDEQSERAYIEKMKTYWVDGFILCSGNGISKCAHELRDEGIPVVKVNRFTESDIGTVDTVAVNNYESAYRATQYLIRSGHSRIALAHGTDELYFYRERHRGYCQALADAGIAYDDALVLREIDGPESFYQLTRQAMAMADPPDAFFATSDPKAFVILHALHDMKLQVPEDVAIMGFDNVALSSMVEPPLSVISQPLRDMGAAAARNLIRQIQYKAEHAQLPPPESLVLNTDLIIRRSTK